MLAGAFTATSGEGNRALPIMRKGPKAKNKAPVL
jgi:hypothetical protein